MSPVQQQDDSAAILAELGSAVRRARERLGWSVNAACRRGDCNDRAWSNVERGQVAKHVTYRNIAAVFNVNADDMIAASRGDTVALAAAVDALDSHDADDPSATLDLTELEDARLLLLLKSAVAELEERLAKRSTAVEALLSPGRRRPGTAKALNARMTRALRDKD